VAILLWGIASFAPVPPLQMRVMEAAKDAPNLSKRKGGRSIYWDHCLLLHGFYQ
jgi:hypothetical protein